MYTDEAIQANVEQELRWDATLAGSELTVVARDKVVALSGYVRNYAQKLAAERSAKRVLGVAGVANDILVRLDEVERLDAELAGDAVSAIGAQLPEWAHTVKVVVEHGYVKLEGSVEWDYQRRQLADAVRRLRGVKGLVNRIALRPTALPTEVKARIEEALKRSAETESSHIAVQAHGGTVTLSGFVRSWGERDEVERAAWMAPGVVDIENNIAIVQ